MPSRVVVHSDLEIMGGTPVFIGTRVPFQTLMDYLEAGDPLGEFLDDFPTVSRDQAVEAIEQAKRALLARHEASHGWQLTRSARQMISGPADSDDLLFEALTPVRLTVRLTRSRWLVIVSAKHPVMAGRELSVREALEKPDEVRKSRIDPEVLLFYKEEGARRWTCAVAKRLAETGFLITAYPTDAIKEGVRIWPK